MSDLYRESGYAKKVREWLYYDSRTGWLMRRDGKGSAMQRFPSAKGVYVVIDRAKIAASRVVWLLHWDRFPPQKIVYGNGSPYDTRIENLGFFDKNLMVKGSGFEWGVCVPDRYGPYPVALFESYYLAFRMAAVVREEYYAKCPIRYGLRGQPKTQLIPSPWGSRVFRSGEWEARDLV